MTYNELKNHCNLIHISVSDLCREIDITIDGLKKGIVNESLALRYVLPLCKSLGIEPNQFFGVGESSGDKIYGAQNKGGKKQIIQQGNTEALEHTIEILKEQLTTKDEQIAAKDRQINKLLGL